MENSALGCLSTKAEPGKNQTTEAVERMDDFTQLHFSGQGSLIVVGNYAWKINAIQFTYR